MPIVRLDAEGAAWKVVAVKLGPVVLIAGGIALLASVVSLFEKKGAPVYQTCTLASAIVFGSGVIACSRKE